MKPVLLALFQLLLFSVSAQKVPVSGPLAVTDTAFPSAMQRLAENVLRVFKPSDPKMDYYDNLFRYQLAARRYASALQAIDSVIYHYGDTVLPASIIGFHYRSYALAMLSPEKTSFEARFTKALSTLYARLPETVRPQATSYFATDLATTRQSLEALLQAASGKDSLTLPEAQALLRAYTMWNVYAQGLVTGKAWLKREEEKKYLVMDSLLIPTRSGAQLSAVIARDRSHTTPEPVVLLYNIYSGERDRTEAILSAAQGYVGIVLNTRGKKLSPQAIEPFEHDGQDIYDVLDWISKQPWCNGKIGMFGGSYLGFSQWSATKKLHPALKTIVPQVAVGIGIDYPLHNGVFMSYMLQWIHYVSNNKNTDVAEFRSPRWDSLYRAWYRSGRSFRALDTLDGRPNVLFQRWLNHPQHDAYWQGMVPYGKEFAAINIPVLTITGYFDDDQRGAFYYLQEHLKWNRSANHYLLIGPWDHGSAQFEPPPQIGNYTLDPVGVMSVINTVFEWFDHVLKDSVLPPVLKDKVNFQVMGTNEWRSVPSLKAASNDSLVYYLSNLRQRNGYRLSEQKPQRQGSIWQEVSYTDRNELGPDSTEGEPTIIDSSLYTGENLVFVSDTLQQDLVISGSVEGLIKCTINKKDVDLRVRIYEQLADGRYFKLSEFLGRASYMKDRTKRQLLQPGSEETIPLTNLFYTCRKMSRGSRLVAVVGVLKSPYWQLNYGTGKEVSVETIADGTVPLQITWSNESFLKIPLLR